MMRPSRIIGYGLPVLALAACGFALWSVMAQQPDRPMITPTVSPPLQPPEAEATLPGQGAGFIGAVGLVEPESEEVAIGTHLPGVVSKVLVAEGDTVRRGAPLFVIDDRQARAQLAIWEARVATARAKVASAEVRVRDEQEQLARVAKLTPGTTISDDALNDVILAVAASGATPYTRAAQAAARRAGALAIAFACNRDTPLLAEADHPVLLRTGPEFLAGSTRLAAGTAQKAALNLFSTQLMVRLGRVYRGHMVAMVASNAKLVARAQRMVAAITGCSPEAAGEALRRGPQRRATGRTAAGRAPAGGSRSAAAGRRWRSGPGARLAQGSSKGDGLAGALSAPPAGAPALST